MEKGLFPRLFPCCCCCCCFRSDCNLCLRPTIEKKLRKNYHFLLCCMLWGGGMCTCECLSCVLLTLFVAYIADKVCPCHAMPYLTCVHARGEKNQGLLSSTTLYIHDHTPYSWGSPLYSMRRYTLHCRASFPSQPMQSSIYIFWSDIHRATKLWK